MARLETWYKQDLKRPLVVHKHTDVFNQDSKGNLIGVEVYSDGEPVALSGSISGYCLLADGTTVPAVGASRSGNKASVLIPQAAYSVPGPITITIKNVDGDNITTLCATVGIVRQSVSGNLVNPGSVVTDWSNDINAQLQAVQTAADNVGAIVAAPFDENTVYVVGNYVTNNGNLYRITADHAAGVAWANTTKVQCTVGHELEALNKHFIANWNLIDPDAASSTETDFLPVELNIRYNIIHAQSKGQFRYGLSLYDSNKTMLYISQLVDEATDGTNYSYSCTFSESSIAYVKIKINSAPSGIDTTDFSKVYFGKGLEYIDFSDYNVINAIKKVKDDVSDLKNIFDKNAPVTDSDAENVDLDITDEEGNVLLRLADGHIKTKNFDSSSAIDTSATIPAIKNDDSAADLDISDTNGNVIARFTDGGIQTKRFDSADVYGTSGLTEELNLSEYPNANYNFEYGNTWTSGAYRGKLIPADKIGDHVRLHAESNKIICVFLTDNIITAGQYPNVCEGTTVLRMGVGADVTIAVPSDCAYLYVYVSKDDVFIGTIHVYAITESSKIKAMIESVQGQIEEIKHKVIGTCYVADTEQIIRTLKHWHTNTFNDFRGYTAGDNLVTIAHISDVHNDPDAYGRFIAFLNTHVGVIDCGIVSGDLVDGPGSDCFIEMVAEEDALTEGTKVLKVVGNHDVISSTAEGLFADMNMAISTDGDKLYYVHDFADRKIRVIVLNQYDTATGTRGKTGHYSQEQIDWFVAKLSEAITNHYQVIVAYHSCSEAGLPKWNGKGFCQNTLMGFNESVSGEHIIEDIINAFQMGGSLVKSVTYPDSGTTVSVNAAFASKGTFVCYICGHAHVDFIGYSQVYPNQLVCMVQGAVLNSTKRTEEQAHWHGMYDTPRVEGTSTQDSINVYAIDPLSRLVKVVKIGSTVTDKFIPRSFATFGY